MRCCTRRRHRRTSGQRAWNGYSRARTTHDARRTTRASVARRHRPRHTVNITLPIVFPVSSSACARRIGQRIARADRRDHSVDERIEQIARAARVQLRIVRVRKRARPQARDLAARRLDDARAFEAEHRGQRRDRVRAAAKVGVDEVRANHRLLDAHVERPRRGTSTSMAFSLHRRAAARRAGAAARECGGEVKGIAERPSRRPRVGRQRARHDRSVSKTLLSARRAGV